MEFDGNKPIYLQIVDVICDNILDGTLKPDGRILSVREYGAQLGEIIYNKRGLGYFISPDARDKVLAIRRAQFLEESVPKIRRQMTLLGFGPEIFE